QFQPQLLLLVLALANVQAVLTPPGYDDDRSPLPLRLEDLEREQEQQQHQLHLQDLNRPPLLPNHYEWRPDVAASLPPSYVQDAALRERERERERQLEELRQLQRQHQQLSAGYAFPAHLPGVLYVGPTATPTVATPTTATSTVANRFLKPIVPYDLEFGLKSVPYVASNALPLPVPLPVPVPRPLPPPGSGRPPFIYGFTLGRPSKVPAATPLVVQQSKQFAYAPATPPQRHYANGPRIPLPYPPSFVSITTRRPASSFRPSQPDPTPDLFAGRNSKSLLDSYIPSWEVIRLTREQRGETGSAGGFRPIHRQTLAYPAPPHLRLFKRDSKDLSKDAQDVNRTRVVKKALRP
ncbi:hypothetical protein KR067_001413, partial [Drosophila pandora]